MRKSRTVVNDLDAAIIDLIASDTNNVFKALVELDIAVPPWSQMLFVFARHDGSKLDASFFEDAKEFFLWYSKVLIRHGEDIHTASFSRKEGIWQIFMPPTLIGVSLQTKLRF